jgi:hypothetical protein
MVSTSEFDRVCREQYARYMATQSVRVWGYKLLEVWGSAPATLRGRVCNWIMDAPIRRVPKHNQHILMVVGYFHRFIGLQ